jgi:uncharacterized membrane protein
MAKTIGNPLSWAAGAVRGGYSYGEAVLASVAAADAPPAGPPVVRTIAQRDLTAALRKGWDDLAFFRSDVVFICLLYPVMGVALTAFALRSDMVQLVFPVLSGFALVGPVAGVGLYEMSRRRERGLPVSWMAYIDVLQSPKFGGIVVLALFHVVVFMVWIMVANVIAHLTMGAEAPRALVPFLQQALTTQAGWAMIVIGFAAGFVFAAIVLAISVVSFPLFLDRDVSLPVAVVTSVKVTLANPVPVATWGLIVAVLLGLGALPLLLGLVFVLPLLGHATWHLYRAAVG